MRRSTVTPHTRQERELLQSARRLSPAELKFAAGAFAVLASHGPARLRELGAALQRAVAATKER